MWSVPDVKHVSGTDPEFHGGPGRNRTTDTRIFKHPPIDRFRSSFIWFSHHVKTLFTKSTCPLYEIDLVGVFD